MAEIKYEKTARVYARLIKEGKRTLESVTNPIVRARVQEILNEQDK